MQLVTVTCNQCGAPLEVAEGARFVTCQYCRARLEVKRSASAVYTEVLSRLDERTAQIAEDVRALREAQEGNHGDPETVRAAVDAVGGAATGARVFGSAISVVMGLMFGAFGIFFATSSSENGAPVIFPIFGGFFALVGLITVVGGLVGALGGRGK